MLTFYALSVKFHIILVIVSMTIKEFYISIIFYKLLPMFKIHVSFLNIAFYLFTCFIPAYSKKKKKGYGKELYVPEGTITVRDSYLYLCFNV